MDLPPFFRAEVAEWQTQWIQNPPGITPRESSSLSFGTKNSKIAIPEFRYGFCREVASLDKSFKLQMSSPLRYSVRRSIFMKKRILNWVLLGVAFFQMASAQAQWNQRILKIENNGSRAELSIQDLAQELKTVPTVLIGEKHYTPEVQKAEASLIAAVVQASGAQNSFTTAWEFLNFGSQDQTNQLFSQFVTGEITSSQFLKMTQGVQVSNTYAPLLEVTRDLGGQLLGVNLSRAQKAPVVEKGIGALDPALLPPGFALGSEGYFERFASLMEGHGSPQKIRNYFEAQCLTDDVMAYHLVESVKTPRKFLIAGGFHLDFLDGTAARLKARLQSQPESSQQVSVIRILDASDYEEHELMELIHNERDGAIANYVYFVNEPMPLGAEE